MKKASEFTILVVDDSDIIRELLTAQLENEGYNVKTAENGEQAIKLIDESSFDLILLDIEMPNISGIDVLRHTKQSNINTSTTVFMLTAQNDSEHVKNCIMLGAKDYILKPFNTSSIKQRIWKTLIAR